MAGGVKTCQKCTKTLDADTQFYQKRNGEKTDLCKKCLTMHIDNFEPETFL
jgi:Zn-finger protein